jgi:hypothetical protein
MVLNLWTRNENQDQDEHITEDMRMARKDIPPGLMTLPLPGRNQP